MEAIKEMEESKTKQQLFSKEDLKKLIVPLLFEQALAITVGMADTVKLVITDSDYGVPSEELIERVQSVIDPTENHGDGIGLAPIDHVVTVAGVTKTRINVVTSVTFAEGYSLDSCFRQIKKAVTDYMSELNSAWDSQTNITVRVSQIEHRIMSIPGVVDVANTGLTTADSSAAVGQSGNIVLDKDAVAECGDISA